MVKERIDPRRDKTIMKLSRIGHIRRYEKALEYADKKSILDAGCGLGYGSELMARKAKEVLGIDSSDKALRYAKKAYPKKNITYLRETLEDLKLKKKFDVITCFEVLEHVEDPDKVLKNFKNLLKKKGFLLLSVPNGRNAPSNNPHHIRDYKEEDLKKMLEKNGFVVEEIIGQYPLLGFLAEIARKITGYSTDTSKEHKITDFFDKIIPNFFANLYKGRILRYTARDIYFVARLK